MVTCARVMGRRDAASNIGEKYIVNAMMGVLLAD